MIYLLLLLTTCLSNSWLCHPFGHFFQNKNSSYYFKRWMVTCLYFCSPSLVVVFIHTEFDVNNYFPSALCGLNFVLAPTVASGKTDSCSLWSCFPLSLKAFYNFLFFLSVLRFHHDMSRGGFIITISFCLVLSGPELYYMFMSKVITGMENEAAVTTLTIYCRFTCGHRDGPSIHWEHVHLVDSEQKWDPLLARGVELPISTVCHTCFSYFP